MSPRAGAQSVWEDVVVCRYLTGASDSRQYKPVLLYTLLLLRVVD